MAGTEHSKDAPAPEGDAPSVEEKGAIEIPVVVEEPEPADAEPAEGDTAGSSEEEAVEGVAEATAEGAAEPVEDQLEAAKLELDKRQNQLLRLAADFDNFRKRSRREVEEASVRARSEVLKGILPVLDDLDRAASSSGELQTLIDGVKMVTKEFLQVLGRFQVARVEAVGQPFDPAVHEAVQQRESTDQPPGVVLEEFRAGYQMGERLLRPAMVVVSSAPRAGAPDAEPPPADDGRSESADDSDEKGSNEGSSS